MEVALHVLMTYCIMLVLSVEAPVVFVVSFSVYLAGWRFAKYRLTRALICASQTIIVTKPR